MVMVLKSISLICAVLGHFHFSGSSQMYPTNKTDANLTVSQSMTNIIINPLHMEILSIQYKNV